MAQSVKSKFTQEVHLKKADAEYGKPQEGTKTAARGRKAHQAISGEIVELCQVIDMNARIPGLVRYYHAVISVSLVFLLTIFE